MDASRIKAHAYLRVSGKDQVHRDGFARQEKAIREYAEANQIEIVTVFRERGVSGDVDGENRPVWVEMIAGMLANGVKTILVEKLDRLARLAGIQEYILLDLKKRGITLTPVDDPLLSSDDPMRVLFRQVVGAIAQYEKTMVVLKLRGARDRKKALTGRCEGAKPYGTEGLATSRKGDIVPESAVLADMRFMRGEGLSPAKIASELNSAGVKPRRGKAWHPHAVARILDRAVKE